jgi:malate synthase
MSTTITCPAGMAVTGAIGSRYEEILTPDALAFLAALHRKFDKMRVALLAARQEVQAKLDAGAALDFLPETAEIRNGSWKIRGTPADLQDRRVEITGPVDRKMVINALNSGARVFMADFEDATTPTWTNLIEGQLNLRDWAKGALSYQDPDSGKSYALKDKIATLIVRPRGWHLSEAHVHVDGHRMSGSLFDFGLYFFHNAKAALARGTGPYFYLPKMEHYLEARLWNDVFVFAQAELGLPVGTIKATVLIETIPAAFQMDEILFELKDHIVGLNCGRWDYIFSFIKRFRNRPEFLLPDRAQVTMGKAFLGAYSLLLIKTCHRRGAHAMGGMAPQIPIKNDAAGNEAALAKTRADKEREAQAGHDGTWVAHPGLVPVATEVFDRLMPGPNQLGKLREDVRVSAQEMVQVHEGTRTEEGLRGCIRVGVQYIEAWIRGVGCVPLYNLMEDAATAEICRAQIWQWLKFGAKLEDGRTVDGKLFASLLAEETQRLKGGRFPEAIDIFTTMSTSPEFEEFLTLPAYERILQLGA